VTSTESVGIAAIGRSATVAELNHHLHKALHQWGFAGFEYYWFAARPGGDRIFTIGTRINGEEASQLCLHPFVHQCRMAYTPVVWEALSSDASVREMLLWSPWKGLPKMTNGGVAIPLHGPDTDFALLSATVTVRGGAAPSADHVHWVHAAALTAHHVAATNCENSRFGLDCVVIDGQRLTYLLGATGYGTRAAPAGRH
jgi:hypothetical protein